MHVFMVFAPAFLEWPLAIGRELKQRVPQARFSGLATGTQSVFDRVKESRDPVVTPLRRLDDMEREWLATPCDGGLLAEYEARLGTETIRRIITSDRQLGFGLVSGGRIPETQLTRAMADPEMVRRYVVGLLRYAFETLGQDRPDLVFCYTVADAARLVLAEVGRHFGIPFAQLTSARIGDLYIVDDTANSMLGPVESRYEEALGNPRKLDHIRPAAREQLHSFRDHAEQPGYMEFGRKRLMHKLSYAGMMRVATGAVRQLVKDALYREPRDLRFPSPMALAVDRIGSALRARGQIRKGPFRAPGTMPDRPFIYFPLHVNPEASTMVLAPMHTDQLAVVEALAKSLPLGMNLVVKEHQPMLGLRPRGFYARLARIPGVVLASPFEDGLELVKRAALTAVITGTAAWEAIRLQRPTLVLGGFPFRAIGQGFVHCPDLSGLPAAVRRALTTAPAEDERLELYLAALLDLGFEFPSELFWGKVTEETVRQNSHIATTLIDRLLETARSPRVEISCSTAGYSE